MSRALGHLLSYYFSFYPSTLVLSFEVVMTGLRSALALAEHLLWLVMKSLIGRQIEYSLPPAFCFVSTLHTSLGDTGTVSWLVG